MHMMIEAKFAAQQCKQLLDAELVFIDDLLFENEFPSDIEKKICDERTKIQECIVELETTYGI